MHRAARCPPQEKRSRLLRRFQNQGVALRKPPLIDAGICPPRVVCADHGVPALAGLGGAAVSATSALPTVGPGPETPILPPGWRTTAVAPCAPLPTGSFRMAFAGVWSCFYGGEIIFRKKIPCHIKRNLLTFVEQKWNASYQWTGQRLRMPYPRIARYGTSRQGFATSGRSGSYIRWTRQPPGGAIRFKELRRATPDLSQKMPTAAPEDTRRGRLCHPHRMPGSPAEGRICAARPGTSAASAHRRPDRVGTGK